MDAESLYEFGMKVAKKAMMVQRKASAKRMLRSGEVTQKKIAEYLCLSLSTVKRLAKQLRESRQH